MQAKPVVRFTKDEAIALLGHEVCSLVEFSGVPIGTNGRVVDIYDVGNDSFDVVIEWDLPSRNYPLRDRFAKDTYIEFLTEDEHLAVAIGL